TSMLVYRYSSARSITMYGPVDQAVIAVGIAPVAFVHRVTVRTLHAVKPRECRDHHEQCRPRQMKVGEEEFGGPEAVPRRDEEIGLSGKRLELAVVARGRLDQSQRCGAHGDDPSTTLTRTGDRCRRIGRYFAPFRFQQIGRA